MTPSSSPSPAAAAPSRVAISQRGLGADRRRAPLYWLTATFMADHGRRPWSSS